MSSSVRKRKTFSVKLSQFDLIHLRDMLSIRLTPEVSQTVSQALAASEDRSIIEARLWQTIVAACKVADVPLEDDAPDFVCAADVVNVRPNVGVFRVATDLEDVATEGDEE